MNVRRLCSLALVFGTLLSSASSSELPKPQCGGQFDLCNFVDGQGAIVIEGNYEKARPFTHGLAAVRIAGLWGFVDQAGKLTVKPQFEAVGSFSGNRASVVLNRRAGIIDRNGDFVIPPRFSAALPFTDDVALLGEGAEHASHYLENETLFHSPMRLYHRSRGWLTSEGLNFQRFRNSSDGSEPALIWASRAAEPALFGLMNDRGDWVLTPRFGHVQTINDGLAVIAEPGREGKWGAVDATGRIVIPPRHNWLSYFSNGHALIGGPGSYPNRKLGLIRNTGVVVAEPIYDKAERPTDGKSARVQGSDIWYEVQANGSLTPQVQDPRGILVGACPEGLKVWQKGKQYTLEDAKGLAPFDRPAQHVQFGIVTENGISGASVLDCRAPIAIGFSEGPGAVGDYTYVRPSGEPLFSPTRYFKHLRWFSAGYDVVGTARSGEGGDWGILGTDGQFTFPLQDKPLIRAARASAIFGKPVFAIGKGDAVDFIDATGVPVPGAKAALDREARDRVLACQGGTRIFAEGERFGMVDPQGKTIVPPVHRALSCFSGGLAWAPRDDRKQWCPLGLDGNFREAPACLESYYPVVVTHHYPEKFADDRHESSVLWVRALLQYGIGQRSAPPAWVGDGIRSQMSHSAMPFRP